MYSYKILLEKEESGGFSVIVPALPGCYTYGEDLDDAIFMAKEANELYLENLEAEGAPISDNSSTIEYLVTV